jgi:EF hand
MRYHRTVLASATALLLLTCTSCSVDQLDTNGDGVISKSEFWSAVVDAFCGNQNDSGTSTDGTSTNGTSTNGTSTNGTSTNGTSTNGTSTNGTSTGQPTVKGTSGAKTGR